jgi:hypothetical protein
MADGYAINFTCPLCGGHQLMLSTGPNDDNAVASCGSCNSEFGRWGDIKANLGITERPAAAAEKPTFKGLSGKFRPGR